MHIEDLYDKYSDSYYARAQAGRSALKARRSAAPSIVLVSGLQVLKEAIGQHQRRN
jgi:hypothetical protein